MNAKNIVLKKALAKAEMALAQAETAMDQAETAMAQAEKEMAKFVIATQNLDALDALFRIFAALDSQAGMAPTSDNQHGGE